MSDCGCEGLPMVRAHTTVILGQETKDGENVEEVADGDGKDCSLTIVAHALGKACVQGHSGKQGCIQHGVPPALMIVNCNTFPFIRRVTGLVFEVLVPRFSSDMVWQRVCWKLLEN
ncbi:hypothetical protein J4Q44_G00220770 [Coregonus suidteri]|uniref:Uncharacterized protein n=1 Tax=Coregonus suidteri TaxID=861788 RepID=A0AAN8LD01_9TELE